MSRLVLIAMALMMSACGIQRPLVRPKDIPAYEQKKQEKMDKRQRDMDQFQREQQEEYERQQQLQQQQLQRQNFMMPPI